MPLQAVPVRDLAVSAALQRAVYGFLAGYGAGTRRDYAHDLKVFLAWCDEHRLQALAVTRPELTLYLRHLQVITGAHGQPLAQATVARRFGTVCVFYGYADDEELLPGRNPATKIRRPLIDRERQRRTYLNPLEFAQLLRAARAHSNRAHLLVGLLGMMGLRIGEATSLSVASLTSSHGQPVLQFAGKGNKWALVPLPPQLLPVLTRVIDDRKDGPLLLNQRGGALDRAAAARLLSRLRDAACISSPLTPHGLRRTFATAALSTGMPIHDVQIAMRHSDPQTTALYDMTANRLDRNPTQRIAAILSGVAG